MNEREQHLKAFCWLMDLGKTDHDMAVKMIKCLCHIGYDTKAAVIMIHKLMTAPKE